MIRKIITIQEIGVVVFKLKKETKKTVLAGGCFDILHIGHITFLEKAKKSGDELILLLESDEAIKKLKGNNRPFNSQKTRAIILSSIEFVDFIVLLPKLFRYKDYEILVEKICPDVIAVTEGDPNIIQKKLQAKKVGGKLKVVLKKIPEYSTTKILDTF